MLEQCKSCIYKEINTDDIDKNSIGWCYMFKNPPEEICMQHKKDTTESN
jgi:hypothetical protein